MENDKKLERLAFYAQYFGQRVFKAAGFEINGLEIFSLNKPGIYAELMPLSSITDEHAIEVGNILDVGMITEQLKRWIDQSFNYNQWSHRTRNIVEAADFLRRNGYLLPYAGYTTDQLIDMGWAKLKQH